MAADLDIQPVPAGPVISIDTEALAERLAGEVLLDKQRTIPVVGVTTTFRGGELVAAGDLAQRLGERAQVYRISHGDATWALSESLPDKLDVYGGAVRIWYPNLRDTHTNPRAHPLFLVYGAGDSEADRISALVVNTLVPPPAVGELVEGIVTRVVSFGVLVDVAGREGIVHTSELADTHAGTATIGDRFPMTVLANAGNRLVVSIRRARPTIEEPHIAPAAQAPETPAAADLAALLAEAEAKLHVANERIYTLEQDLAEAAHGRAAVAEDRAMALEERKSERDRAQRLTKELKSAKDRITHLERRYGADAAAAGHSDEEAFLAGVRQAYERLYTGTDRQDYPLAPTTTGPRFLETFRGLAGIDPARVFEVCAHVACHRAWEIPGLVVKPLKMGKASEQRVRDDGAKAWRANLQTEAASARRLHYWIHPGNPAAVEFDTVSVHDAEI